MIGPVQQEWVLKIPYMQQSVLFAAVRAPDGIRKNHPVKVLMRWFRRCVLLSAFDQAALMDPFHPGGGSFTGPFEIHHAAAAGVLPFHYHRSEILEQDLIVWWTENREWAFDQIRNVYLNHVDELPHHFQLHFMHAAQIIGVHHDNPDIAGWWRYFYQMIVDDAHLHPELDGEMNTRLSDNRDEWKKREVVTAQ